ncbi:6-pyruvoyl trahydropterin synthase family protein [Salinisphaera sp.]|uniref:6-pyruvoyl trahydropterin synthase family protein n=1 Tax=Salinisphaera sp. TaxID=1914330 RepID=UPI002D79C979|nr:6-carboxytetrahydropterin synthase [Salinisphaera sp.]HET7314624.1 6-carboxytetrahydropterin synthase [Salinisphaera sp.]
MKAGDDALQLFIEHVTHIDCGVLDADAGLRGATWLVDATLTGRRGDDGMLFDFGPAKKLLKAEIDALLDHRLLVPAHAPNVAIADGRIDFATRSGDRYRYAGPATATTVLDAETVEPRALARWLETRVAPRMPATVESLAIDLRAESIVGPAYDYTHGLAAHDGNCQRLAHGHRCRLTVRIDGMDRADLAQAWADAWQGVFIGDRADLTTPADSPRLGFGYSAPLGEFALEIAAERCVLLDGPPTVENIADHIAAGLAARHPGSLVEARAYEGVGKGAIATRSYRPRATA